MFRGTNSIPQNIPHIKIECEEYFKIFHGILSVSQNIIMDLNINIITERNANNIWI